MCGECVGVLSVVSVWVGECVECVGVLSVWVW